MLGKTGGARGAVRLAGHEFRAQPAVVLGEVDADEIGDRADVAVDGVELAARAAAGRSAAGPAAAAGAAGLFLRAAVTGADRVDEHQIAGGEPGVRILLELVRRRPGEA